MKACLKIISVVALMAIGAVLPSCDTGSAALGTYDVDTVTFTLAEPIKPVDAPRPGLYIDTNIKLSGMFGGTMESNKPYTLGIDFTDNGENLKSMTISSLVVTYQDGSTDPGPEAMKFPMVVHARDYETTNSMAGGKVVTETVSIISTRLEKVVHHAKPLNLKMKGFYTKQDGTQLPFSIDYNYNVEFKKGEEKALELFKDV